MSTGLRTLLVGPDRSNPARSTWLLGTLGVFVTSFSAYATDVFTVSGGLVWIPFYGALLGVIGAAVVGFARGGLLFGWLLTYAGVLGYHADHSFIGLPRLSLTQQIGYFLRIDGLVYLGVQALVLGSLAFAAGMTLRRGYGLARARREDAVQRG